MSNTLKYIRIHSVNDPLFDKAWDLYEQSFPLNERRTLSSQKQLFFLSNYHFEVILYLDNFIGFIHWWDFDKVRFIEYLATTPDIRGKGLGSQIITQFQKKDNRSVLLEVDLPTDDISIRRIKLYEGLGFIFNKHNYQQPALQVNTQPVDLRLMSYPMCLSETDIKDFIKECHPVLYTLK